VLLRNLGDSMKNLCEPELHSQLFSKDFKKQVEGIRCISEMSTTFPQELVDNLDFLLKYISLRMNAKGSNTIVSLAVLDKLALLFDLLQGRDYKFMESEGFICSHCLIDASGSNNENIRKAAKALMRRLPELYPVGKVSSLLIDAIHTTRNQRVRSESLSEFAELIKQRGLDELTSSPQKALSLVGLFVAERDASVRTASLDCLSEAYLCLGAKQFWKLLVKMPDKEKDIVDSRLKKLNAQGASPEPSAEKSRMAITGRLSLQKDSNSSQRADGGLVQRSQGDFHRSSSPPDEMNRRSSLRNDLLNIEGLADSELMRTVRLIQNTFSIVLQGEAVDKAAGLIRDNCIECLNSPTKQTSETDWENEPESSNPLIANVNGVVESLFVMISSQMESRAVWQNNRAYQSVITSLQSVHEIMLLNQASEKLNEGTVRRVLEVLLWTLHDASLQEEEDIGELVEWMNEVVVDTLHQARPNLIFTVLISLTYEDALLSDQRLPSPDFVDGVLRCLLEMSRRLIGCIERINIDALLRDIHWFLEGHPPSKYRGREFRPLRVLKSILNELVQVKGEEVRDHLTLVPVQSHPTLCSYLDLVFKSRQLPAEQEVKVHAVSSPKSKEHSEAVTRIFDSIDSKIVAEAKEGYVRLRDFLAEHPDFSLDKFMASRSLQFQEHVHKNLAKVRSMVESPRKLSVPKLQTPKGSEDRKLTFSELKSPAATGMLLDKFNNIKSQLEQVPVYKRQSSADVDILSPRRTSDGFNDPDFQGTRAAPVNFLSLQQRIARLKVDELSETSS